MYLAVGKRAFVWCVFICVALCAEVSLLVKDAKLTQVHLQTSKILYELKNKLKSSKKYCMYAQNLMNLDLCEYTFVDKCNYF